MPRLRMLSAGLVLLGLVSSLLAEGQIRSKHFLFGMPSGSPNTNDLIVRDIYALSNNGATKFADWLAYRLDQATVVGDVATSRRWKADPWLDPTATLEPGDYKDANATLKVDRGHQAPLASFRGTQIWAQTNFLSNITPQKAALNQGPWKILEDAVRTLVRAGNTVWVMTGPLYEREWATLPGADEEHKVPSGYWKIVATGDPEKPGSLKATAFIFDQETPRRADFKEKIVRIDEVEQRSGLDFFEDLPEHLETQIEHMVGVWPPGGESND